MSFWARIIKAGSKWPSVSDLIPDNAIPIEVLYDWTDQDNKPSIWQVDNPEKELCRIAVAMQKGKQPSAVTFRFVEQSVLGQSRIKPVRRPGKSLDNDLNVNNHYEVRVATLYEAIALVRIFSAGDQRTVRASEMSEQFAESIRCGNIPLKDINAEMCKWLINNEKLTAVPQPSG